jgi:hypothetical protein
VQNQDQKEGCKGQKNRKGKFSEQNANPDCIPRVLHYFINFLLRSKVLPHIERELRLSLEVIALAMTQYVEYCENLSRQVQLGL